MAYAFPHVPTRIITPAFCLPNGVLPPTRSAAARQLPSRIDPARLRPVTSVLGGAEDDDGMSVAVYLSALCRPAQRGGAPLMWRRPTATAERCQRVWRASVDHRTRRADDTTASAALADDDLHRARRNLTAAVLTGMAARSARGTGAVHRKGVCSVCSVWFGWRDVAARGMVRRRSCARRSCSRQW